MKRILMAIMCVLLLNIPLHAAELTVSAAASLTDAFGKLETMYEEKHPGLDVVMNFAASGPLYKQIEQGAPVDVFVSANTKWMNTAVEAGFVNREDVSVLLTNALVLAVPAGNKAKVTDMASLNADSVKLVAVGTPETVPAGQYAKAALVKAGLWDTLVPKLVYGESVRQVLDYLVRGEVGAGFVYASDAIKGGAAVEIASEIALDEPAEYPMAALKGSAHPEEAKRFTVFLQSEEAKAVLRSFGFSAP